MAAPRGGVPEWPKGTGCKPVGSAYGGSNPPAPIHVLDTAILLLSGIFWCPVAPGAGERDSHRTDSSPSELNVLGIALGTRPNFGAVRAPRGRRLRSTFRWWLTVGWVSPRVGEAADALRV